MQSLPFASAWGSLKLSQYLLDFWQFLKALLRSQVLIQKFIRWIKGLHSFQEPKFLSLFQILANSQLSISQIKRASALDFSSVVGFLREYTRMIFFNTCTHVASV